MAAKEVLDTIEETLDVMDNTMDVLEGSIKTMKNNPWIIAGVALVALSVGATAGYFLAKKKLEPEYEKIAKQEIADAKKFYSILHKKEFSTPEDAAESLGAVSEEDPAVVESAIDAIISYKGEGETAEDVSDQMSEAEEVRHSTRKMPRRDRNIFADKSVEDENWDYDIEVAKRADSDPNTPYVVHHDEYMENEDEHNQVTVTYFEMDDVLVDERERPIPNVDETIGLEATKLFGHGSKDPLIVYIRNDYLGLDFEVVLSHGSYTEQVLGFTDTLEHADKRDHRSRIHKFRGDDE